MTQPTLTHEGLVNTLSDQQMTFPRDKIWATISSHYHESAREKITDFFKDSTQRMVTYGYSSDPPTSHILYRSEHGKLFIVFKTVFYEDIYYLLDEMLYYIFKDHDIEWANLVYMYNDQIFPDME
jgi:hypothetical protein